jgi:hypothetical protein
MGLARGASALQGDMLRPLSVLSHGGDVLVQVGNELAPDASRRTAVVFGKGVVDARVDLASAGRMSFVRRHFLIDRAIGPYATLRFRGQPGDPMALLASLWRVHVRMTAGWAQLDDYFSARARLPDLIRSGKGESTGPLRLLSAYRRVFLEHGTQARFVARTRYWLRGRSLPRRPRVVAWTLGSSYIVARAIHLAGS